MKGRDPRGTKDRARRAAFVVACAASGCFALAAVAAPGVAHADETAPTAEQLFQESRALVEKGDYAAACPKLEKSQELDPAVGTQFNLADCYEHLGRTATAYALFEEVARIARAAGKFEREKSARERATALAPKLAHVHLDVKAAAPGLEIRIDDALVAKSTWSAELPIDPGAHRIVASAPSHASWESTIAARESQVSEVHVPELVDTSVRPAPPAPTTAPSTPPDAMGPKSLRPWATVKICAATSQNCATRIVPRIPLKT
jgi:tetratricopeptide (TPR) repeat protein